MNKIEIIIVWVIGIIFGISVVGFVIFGTIEMEKGKNVSPCFEKIAKDYCAAKGYVFDKVRPTEDLDFNFQIRRFTCKESFRSLEPSMVYKFTEREIERCYGGGE